MRRHQPLVKIGWGRRGWVHTFWQHPIFWRDDLGGQGARRKEGMEMLVDESCDHRVIGEGVINDVVRANGVDNFVDLPDRNDDTIFNRNCSSTRS